MEPYPADGASEALEKAFGQGIECGRGGSEHEQPICEPKHLSLPERADVVEIGKSHRPHSFRRCSERKLQDVMRKTKQMANQIKEPAEVWELEHYLTERRKEIDASTIIGIRN